MIWVFNGFSKTWYQNNWQSTYFWNKNIIKILDHYKRVKIDQKLQILNFKNDFWANFGIFAPFLGILDFFLIEFQNAKILIPRFWKSVKNWIFYKFYHFCLFFFLSNTGLWGTTLHKDLGKKKIITLDVFESKSGKKKKSIFLLDCPLKLKVL